MGSSLSELLKRKDMPIIVSLPENDLKLAQAAIEAGADALKFHINVFHRASGNEFKSLATYKEFFNQVRSSFKGPLGTVIGDDIEKVKQVDIEQLSEVGFDYYSLYAKDIPSTVLKQNVLASTVAVDNTFSTGQLKAIESFGMEAIELSVVRKEDYGKSLNFADMITYQDYRNSTDLPLIVPSQKKLVPEDLTVLKEIGINAVMLGTVTVGTTAESIYQTVSMFQKHNQNISIAQG
ncbi:hypothetical protein [Aquibacillus saliphilus]|uniref:hypothetical protein n=1 Tax=Aquibacillus saliphilus TaxID=1909422 RepID=UPI001CF02228|nr:hypothetical protein [Aquibacillus saliphilus]